MRNVIVLSLLSVLCACATTKSLTPREYLDEQTTATITVVADPVIFVADATGSGSGDRNSDYLELYGLDVNRMGDHRQYLAVMKWLMPKQMADASPVLALQMGSDTIELRAPETDAKKVGIAQPLAPSFSGTSRWWFFPTNTATLQRIAAAHELGARVTLNESSTAYTLFSDGRAQLAELTTVLAR
ncbi:MAG TPA: hypothetical protein VKB34_23060 [Povalibacter sp.]|nr:hypothetical protein [Povalibacter sp.]